MKISYSVKRSARAGRVRLTVRPGGKVFITIPLAVPVSVAERFIADKTVWLQKAIVKMRKIGPRIIFPRSLYRQKRNEAEAYIRQRISELNSVYGFTYQTITIRNQKTRWGSCSRRGNLSFNYRLILLPAELADYVIVHELCHLAEFNHSKNFWLFVSRAVPNYAAIRKELRRYDLRLS